nr:MAG TPA: hypothetical protein [Bacteriophage sp.]
MVILYLSQYIGQDLHLFLQHLSIFDLHNFEQVQMNSLLHRLLQHNW